MPIGVVLSTAIGLAASAETVTFTPNLAAMIYFTNLSLLVWLRIASL
ncbi:hypothetical protein UNSWCS_2090 [Campylobacter concisus UNSWCS]|uniref:Uncharacterized protein n=1 Tax=Campylobacter concisus UNSWCS TaxID=1242968 RepID=U2F7Z6_9BACT|nr:hypothetical protein UNSWCS_2090 [Campylobacter concisus UNSWCS]